MINYIGFFFTFICILAFSCKTELELPDENQKINIKLDQELYDEAIDETNIDLLDRQVHIDSLKQDLISAQLKIYLNYEGGCEIHEFELLISPKAVADKNPKEEWVLRHLTDGDRCLALIGNLYIVDLKEAPFEEEWYLKDTVRLFNASDLRVSGTGTNPLKAEIIK